MLNWFKQKLGLPSNATNNTQPKWAIALICYKNLEYFSQVLESIQKQTINGKPFSHYYDLYIFQDGLQERHLVTSQKPHNDVRNLALTAVDQDHFLSQDHNLGIAWHFDFAEKFLFETKQYPFVVFCEHDMILGPRYLEELTKLAILSENDDRIGMISMHSRHYQQQQEVQHLHRHQYVHMQHSWGFGLFKTKWLKLRPIVNEYLSLLGETPYYQRNSVLINDWLTRKNFRAGVSSQDHIKGCAITACNMVRVSLYVNLGQYIGDTGEHFTPAQFNKMGFSDTVLYEHSLDDIKPLSNEEYERILGEMRRTFLMPADQVGINNPSAPPLPANMHSNKVTEEDVVAAYKFFLGRFPENMEVARQWVGLPAHKVFEIFMSSPEFLQRQQCWNLLVQSAKRVIEINASLERENNAN